MRPIFIKYFFSQKLIHPLAHNDHWLELNTIQFFNLAAIARLKPLRRTVGQQQQGWRQQRRQQRRQRWRRRNAAKWQKMRPLPNEDEKINRHVTGAKVFSSLMKSCSKFFRSCFIFCPFQLFLTGARLSIHSDFLIRTSARDGEVSQQQQQRNRSFPDYFLLFKTIFFSAWPVSVSVIGPRRSRRFRTPKKFGVESRRSIVSILLTLLLWPNL